MWKSLDNVLLICEISLLLAALVTCSTEAPNYSEDHEFGKKIVDEECDEIFTETTTFPGQEPDSAPGPGLTPDPSHVRGPDEEETRPGDIQQRDDPLAGLVDGNTESSDKKIQEKLDKLEELKRKQDELAAEIDEIKRDIGNALVEDDVTIKTSYVSKRLIQGNITHRENVHIMVLPVAETIEKQLMVVLRDREKDLTEFLDILQNNIHMMENTMDLVEDFVNFGTKQASLVFGENSALSELILSGFGPLIENIDSIFNALESLINFKRNILDTFLSENYDREKLLRNIGDIAVKDILPAKVDFVITLLNNSDSIRHDLDHMMYHMGNLITLKQSVIDSVSAYIEQNRNFIQNLIGREFQFDSFFRDLQSGNLFTNITIGPYARRGLFFNEYETRNIIRHYVSMVNPRLPFLESPVKHLLVDKEALQRTEGGDNPKNVDDWLARRISDILTDTYYKFSVRQGDMLISTSSPPLHLGTSCGINFVLESNQLRVVLRRTSQMAVTKGLTYGTRRTPSLDIIASAWLDSDLDLAGRGTINLSKSFIAKCYNKVKQKANVHIVARAKTYLSMKISVTDIFIESRPVENDILVPSYIVGKILPHIVLRFILSLNSELSYLSIQHLKLSNCDVNVFGLKVSTYCNLLEKIFLSQTRDALKQSLPLSSPRAMRQIERAIYKRFGNELYIPLYIDDQRPVESFLLTADNVINVGKKLSDDIMRLVEQMNSVEDTIMNFY